MESPPPPSPPANPAMAAAEFEAALTLPRDADRSGRDLGAEELALLAEVVRSGTLNSTAGTAVARFERAFAGRFGAAHAVACSSGSAAVHAAVASLGLEPGDEIVTTPITDMGAVMPLVYEGAVPVFCDVDPCVGNVTAGTIEPRLTSRTRAIIVTHLFGQPCDMAPILSLARARGLTVIEDCAQAPLARDRVGPVGTLGHLGCFSLQQSKHLTTGEGGMVISGAAEDHGVATTVRWFVNKGWSYGASEPDHELPALNFRMTELQGAVGLAQLRKLEGVVERRRATAKLLRDGIAEVRGVALPPAPAAGVLHSYWRVPLLVDADVPGGPAAVARALAPLGVRAQPHYIRKPAYRCRVFREWARFAVTRAVFERAGRGPEPPAEHAIGVEAWLSRVLVLPWNERYEPRHVQSIVAALREASDGGWR
ncbi:MAG: DegT/DnrJ/EryC1/StrS family aminotransferase [Planctomycetota bacterium]